MIAQVAATEPWYPSTLAGWITLAIAAFALGSQLIALWRADKRPVLAKIEEAKTFFTRELTRVEKDVSDKSAEQRRHIDDTLDDYHQTVTAEINGWAKRFEDDHSDIQRHEIALGEQAGKIIRMDANHAHTDRRMAEMTQRLDEMTREVRDLERRMTKTVTDSEQRIIAAIHERVRILTRGQE